MNVLFLSRDYPPNLIGGVGIYVRESSRLLARLGHRAFVITEAIEHPLEYLDQGVHIFSIKPRKLPLFSPIRKRLKYFTERLEYSYAVSKKIEEVVSRYKIDVIESSEARAEGFWYYLFKNRPPLVIKLHTPEGVVYKLNREPMNKERRLIECLEEWWINRADRLVGLSKSVINLTLSYYGGRQKDIPIVPNPVDSNAFKPANRPQHNNYILYVGRLEYRKGAHVLIRAMPCILERVPQAKFIFIGSDCGMKDYLLKKIAEFGIKDSVEFICQVPREELIPYYQQSALCVVPSLWENHPYVILEAMACGKPVIASEVGGIPELIQNRVNGILVPAGSVSSLAGSIIEVLNDRKLQERLGINARKYIEDQYAPDGVLQKTLDVYKGLLN